MLGSTCQYSLQGEMTLATGLAAVYGLMFSLTDNLPIILSRSRTDILAVLWVPCGLLCPAEFLVLG